MKKFNFTKKAFIGIAFLLLIQLSSFGQGTINFYGGYNGHNSDYYFTTTVINQPCGNFSCSCDYFADIYAGTTSGGSQIYSKTGALQGTAGFDSTTFYTAGFPAAFYDTVYLDVNLHGHDHYVDGAGTPCACSVCSPVQAYHPNIATLYNRGTDDIYAPNNLTATSGVGVDYIDLTWQKGTDIPDDSALTYLIYRDYVLIATVPPTGDSMSYRDSNLSVATSYTYYIETHTGKWGGHTSSPSNYAYGATYSANMQATQGTEYSKTTLTWLNLSTYATNDIQVSRNGQQIAIVNKNSTTYDDFNGIPGVKYLYAVAPINASNQILPAYKDSGYSKPNGVLSGYVLSIVGSGVSGALLTATGIVNGTTYTYTDTTDATGYYAINNIFYNDSANYTLVPTKGTDGFNPHSITRNLNLQNYNNNLPNITDTTVFTITGQVTYANTTGCAVVGAQLYVNGTNTNLVTNAQGNYSYTAQTPGTYIVSVRYGNHTFDYASQTVNVAQSVSGVNFHDTQTDTLFIGLLSGCSSQVCDSARFLVISDPTTSNAGCFSRSYHYDGFNQIALILPAMKYQVSVANAYDYNGFVNANIPNSLNPISIDLTRRDTLSRTNIDTSFVYTPAIRDTLANDSVLYTPADTSISSIDTVNAPYAPIQAARFVYHGTLAITLGNVPTIACLGYVVNEFQPYQTLIMVNEISPYQVSSTHIDTTSCPVDTATVTIADYVSGAGQSSGQTDIHGQLVYPLIPGEPNVPDATTGPYQYRYLFNVVATAGFANAPPLNAWMMVLGQKTLTPSFISKAPPMPFMVLHDPPGSASYSSLEKDSSVSQNLSIYANQSVNAGLLAQIEVGEAFDPPLTGFAIPGAFFNTTISGTGGNTINNNTSRTFTFTANETISTSSDPNYVGFNGDVFMGGTLDTKYAYVYNFTLPTNSCTPSLDTILTWGIDSIESTFIYSTQDIEQTVIPQLVALVTAAPDTGQASKAYFTNQINMWDSILYKDSMAIIKANYTQNITFSAGVSYDYSLVSDSNYEHDYTYENDGTLNTTIGGGISNAQLINISLMAQINASWENGRTTSGVSDNTTTYSYHLEDDIPGNAYSVSIGTDPAFGSPIFKLFSGYSACPWEPGTQHRDVPTLTTDPSTVYDVPAGSPAAFVAYLGNQSESQETRTYQVSVAPETNLDGADIKIAGQDITQSTASFTIGYGQTLTVPLTVSQGPFAADYNNIAVSLSSACDPNVSVTTLVSAHFQTSCSAVSISSPVDGWLANSSNNDTLQIIFTGYDASNPNLQAIGLQYRLAGSTNNWAQGPEVTVSQLIQPYTTIAFNLTNLPDGNYQIRAYASCGAVTGGMTFSPTLNGVIDRQGFNLFGTPSPSNGVLNLGENISVQFNNSIDCNQTYEPIVAKLNRNDNGALVPDTFICSGTGLILNTYPGSLLDSLDGVTLTATVNRVHDINGNLQSAPISWSFLVSRSQVFWSPANINVTAILGTGPTVTGTMANVGPADTFTIAHLPSWLTVTTGSPYILTQGTPQSPSLFPLSFTVSNSMNEGHYTDTVIALANGKRLLLFVTLDVVTQAPNWTVNANNFQYSMNITTNYSKTSQNAPLSTDTRDIIAAFVGNQCRGVGNIVYNAVSNTYSAFITAYSNSAVGDTFSFRMWDALPGIEYQAVERLPFITDGSIGQPAAPYILHPAGEFQTITFAPGWNWFSLNVASTDMSPANVLSSITGNNGAVVKAQNVFDQFTTATPGWTGALTAFNTNSSYLINLDHADTLHFLGQPVTDTSIISVRSGWNWIGLPRQKITTAASFLSTANASDSDLLKSQTLYTEFTAGNWIGSLNYMYPGQGYKLRSTNGYNFVIPPARSLPNWNVNENLFEQNMTVTADLQFNGTSTTQSNYLVGAFANGICIGTAQPEFIPSLNIYRVFISIQGDTGNAKQPITFKVYDTDNDIEYVPTYTPISVVPDTIVAKVEAPYVINVQTTTGVNAINYTDGFSLLQNVPNPFSKTTTIDYAIPAEQQVTITLYDESGRLIRELVNGTQAAGTHSVSVEQDNLQPGVYLYQMKSGEFVKTRRMLVL